MNLPQVAIVGRPNVGKSSLLNRLAGKRVSIVDPTPGVTRDRVSAVVTIHPPTETPKGTPKKTVEFIDTGGFGVYTADGKRFDEVGADLSTLTEDIEGQILAAIEQADLVLLTTDAQTGVNSLDQAIASLIRRSGHSDKVIAVANKVDDETWIADAAESAKLGFGAPMGVSATNGFGIRELTELLYERLGDAGFDTDENEDAEIKIAIVGKRNSGKSTLINAWAGEERIIVSEIAGTTRDSIDVRLEFAGFQGRPILAIDTAGARKKKSFADDIEFYAHTRMLGAMKRADVVLLLIDATQEVSQVDQKLAQEVQELFKPVIIVVNKWDLVTTSRDRKGEPFTPDSFLKYLTQQLRGLEFAPIVFISAKNGEGLRELAGMIFNLHEQSGHRETTGHLNAAIRTVLEQRGPSSKGGGGAKRAKVYYVSQVAVRPPTIVLSVNDPELFHGQYERYLLNELREVLPFSEVPIRLFFRARERAPLEDMKRRGQQRERAAKQLHADDHHE